MIELSFAISLMRLIFSVSEAVVYCSSTTAGVLRDLSVFVFYQILKFAVS